MNAETLELLQRLEGYSWDDPAAVFPFSRRLARDNGWTPEFALRAIREYKRFIFLALTAGHPVTPSEAVDQVWHLHLLYTEAYWKEFCGRILGRPLHHHPTKGGRNEGTKFEDWYLRTQQSYREFFGEDPPEDLWPAPSRRFGEDIQCVRVNTARHWIVPKPQLMLRLLPLAGDLWRRMNWRSGAILAFVLLLAGASGCAWEQVREVWPFDLPGEDFLELYFLAWLASVSLAAWLRWYLRKPTSHGWGPPLELDPYAVACLSDRSGVLVFNAAAVHLVEAGAVRTDPNEPRLLRLNPIASDAHPFEQAIYQAIPLDGATVANIRQECLPLLEVFKERLGELGLLMSRTQAKKALVYPLLIALVMPALGLLKIEAGLARGRPVEWLITLCALTTVVALAGFARRPHRGRWGDQVLNAFKERHEQLEYAPTGNADGQGSSALPLAIGLFGMGVLVHTPLAGLEKNLTPKKQGGCGGGCGGGDGGGGGCGGCGG